MTLGAMPRCGAGNAVSRGARQSETTSADRRAGDGNGPRAS